MDIRSARKFLQANGRNSFSRVHHRQGISVGIVTALLALVLIAHTVEALVHMLAALGRGCVWCAVTPY